jgi:hypothetical protein
MKTFDELTEAELRTLVELCGYIGTEMCADGVIQPMRYHLREILGLLPTKASGIPPITSLRYMYASFDSGVP